MAQAVREPELRAEDVARHTSLRLAEIEHLLANSAHRAQLAFRTACIPPRYRASRVPEMCIRDSYYADRVSSDLERAEQAARMQAEREQRMKEEAERRAEMEEQRRVQERLARERARWQQELRN